MFSKLADSGGLGDVRKFSPVQIQVVNAFKRSAARTDSLGDSFRIVGLFPAASKICSWLAGAVGNNAGRSADLPATGFGWKIQRA